MTEPSVAFPHDNLYARLRVSPGKGIGVFAIRDIPPGCDPFRGEASGTARVPAAVVDAISDPDLRQMYLDFCPLVDGAYVAPADFNRMTTAWYMNHSDRPNIVCDRDINFVARELIKAGAELLVDYTSFSDHAERYVALWRRHAG